MNWRIAPLWAALLALGWSAPAFAQRLFREEVVSLSTDHRSRVLQLRPVAPELSPPVVTAVSLQSGGVLFATAGDTHDVHVWTHAGELRWKLHGHTDWVRTVAFAPSGKLLASAGNDRKIFFWDPATGERLKEFAQHEEAVVKLIFSHNGQKLAALGFQNTLNLYEVESGRLLQRLECPCSDMRAAAFSADDAMLAIGGRSGVVRLYDVERGALQRDIRAHRQRIRDVAFSPSGEYLVSSGEDRVVRVWNLRDESESFALPSRPAKWMSLTFCGPDRLATGGSDNLIHLWDLGSRQEEAVLDGHTGTVAALDYVDNLLISGSYDTTVRVWELASALQPVVQRESADEAGTFEGDTPPTAPEPGAASSEDVLPAPPGARLPLFPRRSEGIPAPRGPLEPRGDLQSDGFGRADHEHGPASAESASDSEAADPGPAPGFELLPAPRQRLPFPLRTAPRTRATDGKSNAPPFSGSGGSSAKPAEGSGGGAFIPAVE